MKLTRTTILAALVLLIGTAATSFAADKAELQKRFQSRYGQIQGLKSSATIGETASGTVEAVKGKSLEKDQQKLVSEENADRQELYQLIAKETNTTAAAVAETNAARNFSKARKGEWLKDKQGNWSQK